MFLESHANFLDDRRRYYYGITIGDTMQAMSLKVEDDILLDAEHFVKRRKISRNAYINEAIRAYNALERRRELREKLLVESKLVAADSLAMLKELEMIVVLHEA